MKKLLLILIGFTLILVGCSLDETNPSGPSPEPEPLNQLCINEFMSHNDNIDIPEAPGEFPDWIELYNGTDQPIDVGGMYLTDDMDDLTQSMIPTDDPTATTIQPAGFLVFAADGNPEEGIFHLDFKLSDDEDFALVDTDGSTILDGHNSSVIPDDQSEGRVPDGYNSWEILNPSTPGTSNGGEPPAEILLYINEFMASNDYGPVDEHGNHDDWIEIYNAGAEAVDIGGMWLTDNLEELQTSQIPEDDPSLTTIPAGGFLVLWADKEPEQGILHLNDVKLSGGGEQIGLTASDGETVIDSLTYGDQTTDISKGRLPDGSDDWDYFGQGHATMYTPGESNDSGEVPQVLYINEFMASNDYGPVDDFGEHDDWIEIFNAGDQPVDIGGMYVTDDLTDLTASQIPEGASDLTTIEPGGFILLWADKDGEQGPLHLDDVKLSSDGEQIGLTDIDGSTILDSLTYGEQTTDISCGKLPNGSGNWTYFGAGNESMYTPGYSNGTGEEPNATFYINEFMASNETTIADSAGEYDDWIEIYNGGNICGDLGGYYLTDDLEELAQSQLPDSLPDITTIPPKSFLLLWADKDGDQGPLHLDDTKLSGDGEQIGLIAADGTTYVDSLTYGEQTTDVSKGRLPDGADNWQLFEIPTPGTWNH